MAGQVSRGRSSSTRRGGSSAKKSTRSRSRKPRGTRRKRKPSLSLKYIVVILAGLAVLLLALSLGVIYYKGSKAPSRLSCLQSQNEITTAILGVLFREGLSHHNVKWKSQGSVTFFTLKTGKQRSKEIYKALFKDLAHRYEGLRLRENGHGSIQIFCRKRVTHQLAFAPVSAPYHSTKNRQLKHAVPTVTAKPAGVKGIRVAVVIDDIGYDISIARDFLNLPVPVTLSIFPYAPHSREIAKDAKEKGHEILMHLPMEPEGYPGNGKDPGPGALYVKMTPGELVRQINSDLDRIPLVCGVNNHMGSRFTCDPKAMRILMETLKKRKKFFLDSRTSAKSVGFKIAKEIGIPAAERDVFMDNVRDVKKIREQLDCLIEDAKKRGYAVGIGHPHRATYLALKKAIPDYQKEGVKFVFISSLVH